MNLDTLLAPVVAWGPALIFWTLALVTIVAAVAVVASRQPIHSALFLLLTFVSVAALFVTRGAEFVGAVQVFVYAGGIMVLFLFVVMVVDVRAALREGTFHPETGLAAFLGFVLLGAILFGTVTALRGGIPAAADAEALRTVPPSVSGMVSPPSPGGNSHAVGLLLYGRYLVPFEVASILLLVAMIGAIVLGKKRLESAEVDR